MNAVRRAASSRDFGDASNDMVGMIVYVRDLTGGLFFFTKAHPNTKCDARRYSRGPAARTARLVGARCAPAVESAGQSDQRHRSGGRHGGLAVPRRPLEPDLPGAVWRRRTGAAPAAARTGAAASARHGARVPLARRAPSGLPACAASVPPLR